jgi:chromosome segregation ATPase
MSVSIEVDLKEILGKLDQRLERMETNFEQRLERMETNFEQRLERMETNFEQRLERMEINFEQRFNKIDDKFDKVDERLNKLEVSQVEIKGEIKTLNEKVAGIDTRLKNQEFINRSIFVGLLLALLGGAAKLFGFAGN